MDRCSRAEDIRQAVLSAALTACKTAADDFGAAIKIVRLVAVKAGAYRLAECGRDLCASSQFDECACFLYILAEAVSREIAASIGKRLLETDNDVECLVIAQSDLIDTSTDRFAAVSLLERYFVRYKHSAAFIVKLADHYRNAGQSSVLERLLRLTADSNRCLLVRLAEHWVEFQEWYEAFKVLRALPSEFMTAETIYMLGRSSAALLMPRHVEAALRRLRNSEDGGSVYADMLEAVWEWRVGDEAKALALCPCTPLATSLIERDRLALDACRTSDVRTATVSNTAPALSAVGGAPDLPNVLMIGMQRTATSWFWQVFGTHSDVQPMTFKETTFFNEHFRGLDLYPAEARGLDIGDSAFRYWEGPTRSLARFRGLYSDDRPIRMDVSPSYAELPPATVASVRNILGSDAKIIICFRDPIERCWSNLKLDQKLAGGRALDLTFDHRKAFYDSSASRRRSEYMRVFHTWRRQFKNMHVILFDDIVGRPWNVIDGVCAFMGICRGGISDILDVAYASDESQMPVEDRAYLLERFAATYKDCESFIGPQASIWHQQQIEMLSRAQTQLGA